MWFATGGGLVRYDGIQFTLYSKDDGLVGNVVRSVFQDDDGSLWITSDEGISVFDGKTFKNYTSDDGLGTGSVWKTVKDKEGQYWFPTSFGGISKFDRNKFTTLTKKDGLKSNEYRTAFMDSRGGLWFGGKHGVVWREYGQSGYRKGFNYLSGAGQYLDGFVNKISEDAMGRILFCTENGLVVFDESRWLREGGELRKYFLLYTDRDGLAHDDVAGAITGRDSSIWIATDYGLSKFQKNRFKNYFVDENYSSNSMQAIFMDRESNLWVGTNGGGCVKIPYLNIYNFTVRDGLSSNVVNAIAGDDEGRIYIANDNGVDMFEGTTLRSISKPWHGTGDAIWSLKFDRKKNLWIGSEHHLYQYKNNHPVDRNDIYSAGGATILDIEEDVNGWLWIGTLNGLSVYDGKNTVSYTQKDGLPGNQVWCVYIANDQTIWLGVSGGLVRVDQSVAGKVSFKTWTRSEGMLDNTVNVVRQDEKGQFWIGTDLGISKFDGVQFTHYRPKTLALADNIVPVIEYDHYRNAMWFGSKGYALYDHHQEPPFLLQLLNRSRGMAGDEATTNNSLYIDAKGSVWIGSFGGLTRFVYDPDSTHLVPPLIHVERVVFRDSVRVIDNLLSTDSDLDLGEIKGSTITFEFAGLSFAEEKDNTYYYQLEGFDKDWLPSTKRNEVRYTNLDPGRYTFIVNAVSSQKQSSRAPSRLSFTVPTPLWLHPLFLMVTIMAAAIGAYGLYKFRVNQKIHRLRLQTRILENKVIVRTSELVAQKEELQNLLDKLQQTQTQLVQSEKMAALGQLVAGVAHEINNPTSILAGNVTYIEDYVRTLQTVIQKYEAHLASDTDFARSIDQFKKEVDYQFISSDLNVLLASIKNASDRIRHIVLDLRNFSRLDEVELNEADIHECVETTVKLFMNQFKHLLVIERDYRSQNKIYCYVNQINQVILNLLVNAAQAIESKFSSPTSEVIKGIIRITTLNMPDSGVKVCIRDNGHGIPDDIKPRIFDPFFTTKPVGQGTGLGLSISYGIIQKHHGTISCTGQVNEWTEFTFTLPHKPHEIPS